MYRKIAIRDMNQFDSELHRGLGWGCPFGVKDFRIFRDKDGTCELNRK